MSSFTSLRKRGGLEHSKSSDNPEDPLKPFQRSVTGKRYAVARLAIGLIFFCLSNSAFGETPGFIASETAAAKCRSKINKLMTFPEKRKPGQRQTTRFSQKEINSYLALDLSSQYHPCLKRLIFVFEENRLEATATIDIDRLGAASQGLLPKLVSLILAGIHTLAADGKLVAEEGKAYFKLEQALFDGTALPKPLIERIISIVGQRQNPPFDPLQSSEMPYEISKVDVKSGYIIVVQ